MELNLDLVRKQFPSLQREWTLLDNAGGSQTLQTVVNRISEYLTTSDVQLGASYEPSQIAGQRLQDGYQFGADLMNARDVSEVIFGSSTTMLLRQLALSMSYAIKPGDEIIVTNCDHEANIGGWKSLERFGAVIKIWEIDKDSLEMRLEDLEKLLGEKTKLVAITHASNILGTINPIKKIAAKVHEAGAWICVDAVAYAPHRQIDVQELDVDFYVFSFYKVYGPHNAMLFGRKEILQELAGINHFFIGAEEIPYKFQPGNTNYELTYGYLGFKDYIEMLCEKLPELSLNEKINQVYQSFANHEEKLSTRLLDYLNSKNNIRIIGEKDYSKEVRVPTISFVVENRNSQDIVELIDPHKIGIRFGDFYARHLIEDLGLAPQNGVVRVSAVHYNTLDEIDSLIRIFDQII